MRPLLAAAAGLAALLALAAAPRACAQEYKSAELVSKKSFKFGAFETSMKASSGSGGITGFVLLKPGSFQGEWQELAFEVFGKDPSRYQTQVIVPGPPETRDQVGRARSQHPIEADAGAYLSADFHTYRIEWEPDAFRFLLDGKEVRAESKGSSPEFGKFWNNPEPMEIRLTLWGGHSSWSGQVDSSSLPTPARFAYVRQFPYENGGFASAPAFDESFDGGVDGGAWALATWTDPFLVNVFAPQNAAAEGGDLVIKFTR